MKALIIPSYRCEQCAGELSRQPYEYFVGATSVSFACGNLCCNYRGVALRLPVHYVEANT